MWNYEKRLEYPINITTPNPKLAQLIISQYGGPDGEMGASLRYLSQRYSMPYREVAGVLTDIGTEETDTIAKGGSVISCRHNAWTDSFHTISHELIKYVGDDLVYPWIDSLHETDDDSVLNSVNVYSFIKEFNIPRDVYDELITYSTSYYL